MKKITVLLFLLVATTAIGQKNGQITGHLIDGQTNGEPMLFASIGLKNSSFETQSNFHGNFELNNISSGEYILVIASLGYERIEVPIQVKAGETLRIEKEMKPLSISSEGTQFSEVAEENTAEKKTTTKNHVQGK